MSDVNTIREVVAVSVVGLDELRALAEAEAALARASAKNNELRSASIATERELNQVRKETLSIEERLNVLRDRQSTSIGKLAQGESVLRRQRNASLAAARDVERSETRVARAVERSTSSTAKYAASIEKARLAREAATAQPAPSWGIPRVSMAGAYASGGSGVSRRGSLAYMKALTKARETGAISARGAIGKWWAEATGGSTIAAVRSRFPQISEADQNVLINAEWRKKQAEARIALTKTGGNAFAYGSVGFLGLAAASTAVAGHAQALFQHVQGNTGMNDAQMTAMKSTTMQLSKQSGASLDELAKGYMHIANYGYRAADANNILVASMKAGLATGTQVSLVAQLVAKTLHTYGMSASMATGITNGLWVAAAHSDQTMANMVEHSGRAFAMAANLGLSFQQAAGAMELFTRRGLDSNLATIQLVNALAHLIHPSKLVAKELKTLSKDSGVDLAGDFSLAGLKSKQLTGIFSDMQKAAKNLGVPVSDLAQHFFPDLRGTIGALIAANGLPALKKAVKDVNTAMYSGNDVQKNYEKQQKTIGAETDRLKQKLEIGLIPAGNDFIKMLTAAEPVMDTSINFLTGLLGIFTKLPRVIQEATLAIAAFAVAAKFTGGVLGGITTIKNLITAMGKTKIVAEEATVAEEGLAAAEGTAAAGAAAESTALVGGAAAGAGGIAAAAGGAAIPLVAALAAVGFAASRIGGALSNNAAGASAYNAEGSALLSQNPRVHALTLYETGKLVQQAVSRLPHNYTGSVRSHLEGLSAFQGSGKADLQAYLSVLGANSPSWGGMDTSMRWDPHRIAHVQNMLMNTAKAYKPPKPFQMAAMGNYPHSVDQYLAQATGAKKSRSGTRTRHARAVAKPKLSWSYDQLDMLNGREVSFINLVQSYLANLAKSTSSSLEDNAALGIAQIGAPSTSYLSIAKRTSAADIQAKLAGATQKQGIFGNELNGFHALVKTLGYTPSAVAGKEAKLTAELAALNATIVMLTKALAVRLGARETTKLAKETAVQEGLSAAKIVQRQDLASSAAAAWKAQNNYLASSTHTQEQLSGLSIQGQMATRMQNQANTPLMRALSGYNRYMGYAQKAMGAYGMIQQWGQPATAGNIMGDVQSGSSLGSSFGPSGTLIGAGVGLIGGLLGSLFGGGHHSPPAGSNLATQLGPSSFDYMAYRYRLEGNTPLSTLNKYGQLSHAQWNAAAQFNSNAPQVNIFLDGVKQAVTSALSQASNTAMTSNTSLQFNGLRPI